MFLSPAPFPTPRPGSPPSKPLAPESLSQPCLGAWGHPAWVPRSMFPTCGQHPDLGLQPDISPELQPEGPAASWTKSLDVPQAPKASTSQPNLSGSHSSAVLVPHLPRGQIGHLHTSLLPSPLSIKLFYLGGGREEGEEGRREKFWFSWSVFLSHKTLVVPRRLRMSLSEKPVLLLQVAQR